MRRADELPTDPEVAAGLETIDAALTGRPVDPAQAELAELALALAADRPEITQELSAELDQQIARRRAGGRTAPRRAWWLWSPAAGLAACLLAAGVIIAQEGGAPRLHPAPAQHPASAQTATQTAPEALFAAPAPGQSARSSGAGGESGALLQPPSNGRKITQSAQLTLTADPSRIDAVAQEVYDVIGQARGVVNSSTVTAGGSTGGYAQFQLSVPSSSLPQTMAALSSLRYANVAARTDTNQDVNDEYQRDVRQLADARALRASLLRQLAGASSQAEIDSLTRRIHDAEASISSDQATLAKLNQQIDFSQIALTINPGSPSPAAGDHGGFTFGKAAHTAGRVLTVAAGIILIAGAVLLPLAALAALVLWATIVRRRRRRRQVLDLV